MTDVEMLRIALGEEEKAIKLYQGMLEKYPNLKDLLSTLIAAEQGHKNLIGKKIADLTR
jgi:rubrerythrin